MMVYIVDVFCAFRYHDGIIISIQVCESCGILLLKSEIDKTSKGGFH